MTFLPLVERELRVASRQRVTYWLRIVAALVALILGAGFVALTLVGMFPLSTANLGRGLFATLTWIGLVAALLAGPFLTSDCLSGEKRDGTLGFLFLTDLRGHDVVLGKLFATALRAGYALLALLPVLALTFTMGGVSSAQFGKTAFALANALFLSLAAGQFASSLSREAPKALGGTLVLLAILVFGGPLVDSVGTARAFTPVLSWTSPGFLFLAAGSGDSGPFWTSLLIGQVLGWGLLIATGFILQRTWQEKGEGRKLLGVTWFRRWRPGRTKNPASLRNQLLSLNPVLWLMMSRRGWEAGLMWTATLVLGLTLVFLVISNGGSNTTPTPTPGWTTWSWCSTTFTLLIYLGAASQAVRFHVEARRSGLLELILTTPLTGRRIMNGQWRGLLRRFGPPLVLCLAFQSVGEYFVQRATWSQVKAVTQTSPGGTTTNGPSPIGSTTTNATASASGTNFVFSGIQAPPPWVPVVMVVVGTLSVVANLITLIWYGLWRGLISKGINTATLTTLLYAQVIPWFVIMFAGGMTIPLLTFMVFSRGSPGPSAAALQAWIPWIPLILITVVLLLSLIKDVGFLIYARTKLFSEFRARASQVGAPVLGGAPPVLSPLNRSGEPSSV